MMLKAFSLHHHIAAFLIHELLMVDVSSLLLQQYTYMYTCICSCSEGVGFAFQCIDYCISV